jgi:hypothetical protein
VAATRRPSRVRRWKWSVAGAGLAFCLALLQAFHARDLARAGGPGGGRGPSPGAAVGPGEVQAPPSPDAPGPGGVPTFRGWQPGGSGDVGGGDLPGGGASAVLPGEPPWPPQPPAAGDGAWPGGARPRAHLRSGPS